MEPSGDFWVAAATVAPVLLLAQSVNVSRYWRWRSVLALIFDKKESALRTELSRATEQSEQTKSAIHRLATLAPDLEAAEIRKEIAEGEKRAREAEQYVAALKASEKALRRSMMLARPTAALVALSAVGWIANCLVLGNALWSLSDGADRGLSRGACAGILFGSALLAGAQVVVELMTREGVSGLDPDTAVPD